MPTNPTIATYDAYAQVYDAEIIEFWQKFPKEFFEQLVHEMPGKRVLDVGSGSGRDALLLKDYGLDVVCVDGSGAMIEMTKKLGFKSIHSDFSNIDFPAQSFDAIWAYTSLLHIPKEQAVRVIKHLHGLLKPQGIFAIGMIEGTAAGMVTRESMPGSERYFKQYQRDELRAMMERCGFVFGSEIDYQPRTKLYLNQLYRLA